MSRENRFVKEAERLTKEKETNTAPERREKAESVSLDAILDTIETKDECKNYTFYLKKRNMDRLSKLAKTKKISVSKLLDNIISNLLGD